jgi:flavin reductase (DIM6/NTAB) family NADH-FMN oxidoreductase RutF
MRNEGGRDLPSSRATVEAAHASRLLNHGPTVLVSTLADGRRNLMAAAWSMPVEFTPPRIAVVIDKTTYTREQVMRTGMLALNIPCRSLADLTYTVGSVSGRAEPMPSDDKFDRYGIASFAGPTLGLPLVEGCVGWLECRVIAEPHTEQAYDTFFVEAVSALSDTRVFANGRWSLDGRHPQLHTLHHLGAGLFAVAAETVQAELLPGTGRQS